MNGRCCDRCYLQFVQIVRMHVRFKAYGFDILMPDGSKMTIASNPQVQDGAILHLNAPYLVQNNFIIAPPQE